MSYKLELVKPLTVDNVTNEIAIEIIKTQTIEEFFDKIVVTNIGMYQHHLNIEYYITGEHFRVNYGVGVKGDYVAMRLVIDSQGNIYEAGFEKPQGTLEYVETLLNLGFVKLKQH